VALYYKGRMRGGDLFDKVAVTAHVDTAKRRETGELLARVVDPDRTYAVYGDSSTEVVDANARGKLYVHVEADRSKLTVGSFPVDLKGVEFLRYDRVVDGGRVHFVREWDPGYGTEVRAFGTVDDERARPAHDELRGTGGSLYYLQHDTVLTGSERVSIVVRDRDTGMVLKEVPQGRDVDYTIQYEHGRILFKSPVASSAEAAFLAGGLSADRDVLDGHPVYVVVTYEHWDRDSFGGDGAGVHVRQALGGVVTLGGGYLTERHSAGGDYSMWSLEATAKPWAGVELEAEYAESQAGAGLGGLSLDGGLSWKEYSLRDRRATDASGRAMLVSGKADLAKTTGREGRFVDLRAYYRLQDPGFYSWGSLLEQGTEKYGLSVTWQADARNQVYVGHDGGLADVAEVEVYPDFRTAEQERTTVRYVHREKDWQALAEYAHLYWDATHLDRGVHSNVVAGGGTYRVDEGIDLSLRQDVVIDGDEALLEETGDHLATTASMSIEVVEDLYLTATERLRWTGENAAAVGFRTRMDDGTDVYVQERLWSIGDRAPRDAATVLGASKTVGPDGRTRTFAEYQIAGAGGGPRNRALLGMGRRFRVLPGLTLDAAYERAQVAGGVFGDTVQDAASAAFEWLAEDVVKLSGRYEVRREDRDETAGHDDLLQLLTLNSIEVKPDEDVTLFGRINYSETWDQTLDRVDARLLEGSVGLAFRPVGHDWFHGLLRYSARLDRRPGGLLGGEIHETESHVVSVVPVIDTPHNVQLVNKVAFRAALDRTADLDEVRSDSLLTLHRVNYHVLPEVDLGLEYRFLRQFVADDLMHGVLMEASYILQDLVRVGMGYNFTSFSDNEFPERDVDPHGAFFRVTGQY